MGQSHPCYELACGVWAKTPIICVGVLLRGPSYPRYALASWRGSGRVAIFLRATGPPEPPKLRVGMLGHGPNHSCYGLACLGVGQAAHDMRWRARAWAEQATICVGVMAWEWVSVYFLADRRPARPAHSLR